MDDVAAADRPPVVHQSIGGDKEGPATRGLRDGRAGVTDSTSQPSQRHTVSRPHGRSVQGRSASPSYSLRHELVVVLNIRVDEHALRMISEMLD